MLASEKNLLCISNTYPNVDLSFVGSNFIKNQVDETMENFNKVYCIAPLIRSFGTKMKEKLCKDYSYENIDVIYPKTFYLPKMYRDRVKINIDFRTHKILQTIKKKQISFNIIHAHFGPLGVISIPIAIKFDVPLITSFYGYDAYQLAYQDGYYDDLFNKGEIILTLSNHMTEQISKLGCSRKKIEQLNIGIDLNKFKPNYEIKKENKEEFIVTIIANFVEKKGIFDAIEAINIARRENKNIKLLIVGDGPLLNKILEKIGLLNLSEVITIINNYSYKNPRSIVLKALSETDIFILPSRESQSGAMEGTPVVLMEASAFEKACITTEHSGNSEVVIKNKTGFVVDERDILGLSESILKLANNPELREKMGKAARKHIELHYNSIKQYSKLREIYLRYLDEE